MKLTLEQNKHLKVVGGLEELGASKFPGTKETFNIPLLNGNKLDTSPLTAEEIKMVENKTGQKFATDSGKEYYSTLTFTIPSSTVVLNTDNVIDFLTYKYGVKLELIAETETIASHPMSKHKFFVFNSEVEEELKATRNEKKAEVFSTLRDLKNNKDNKIIYIAKDVLGIYGTMAILTAFNKLTSFVDEAPENVNKVLNSLDKNYQRLQLDIDIKDAIHVNILKRDISGFYYNKASGTKLGRNPLEIAEFYLDPKNADELEAGAKSKETSLRNQLKNINK